MKPKLSIGSRVNIGQELHIACAGEITIEDDVLISAGVFITDLSHETSDKNVAVIEQGISVKPVKICEGAFIGRGVSILPGVTVGKHSVVGSNAVVTKDVPDFAVVGGVPAKIISER
ncbi:MAG: acyltransferase [Lachnospiraceae bacterium]|nr:acyltransferase [Lachnospiraceae bacterium]